MREQFSALRSCCFLNTATLGQVPRCAVDAINAHLQHRDELAGADLFDWFDAVDEVRASVGKLVGCEGSDIAFIPHASQALSLVFNTIDWKPGDRVVTLESEFPNHYYFAGNLASRGVQLVEVPLDRFFDAVDDRTRLVTISTVNYSTGLRAPVEEISRFVRERDIFFYLDGTQSVGALKTDLSKIQPSVFAVDAYKWMLTPQGIGFMYVRPDVREWMQPQVIGWRSHKAWRDPDNLHHGTPEFKTEAERYEGGIVNFTLIFALGAVVDLMLELGADAIETRVMELAKKTRDILRAAGGELTSNTKPHHDSPIVTARFAGLDASDLSKALRAEGVHVAARKGSLRVSPTFYNNEPDLEHLSRALMQIQSRLLR